LSISLVHPFGQRGTATIINPFNNPTEFRGGFAKLNVSLVYNPLGGSSNGHLASTAPVTSKQVRDDYTISCEKGNLTAGSEITGKFSVNGAELNARMIQ
jgi:hypothetical protein